MKPSDIQPENVKIRRKSITKTMVGQGDMPKPSSPKTPAPTPDPEDPCEPYEIKAPWHQNLYFEMQDDYWWHDPFIQIFSGGSLKRRKRYYQWRQEGWAYKMYYPCNPYLIMTTPPHRYETISTQFVGIWDDAIPGNEGVAAGSGGRSMTIGIEIGAWDQTPKPYINKPSGPPATVSNPELIPETPDDKSKPPLNGFDNRNKPVNPIEPDEAIFERLGDPIRVAAEGYGPVNIKDVNSTVSEAHLRSRDGKWSSGDGVIFQTGTIHTGQELLDAVKEPYLRSRSSLVGVDPKAQYYIERISMTPYSLGTEMVGDDFFEMEVKYAEFIMQLRPIYEGTL